MVSLAVDWTGGIFHDIDIYGKLGKYPTQVAAQGTALTPEIANIGDYDTVFITLKFPSGSLAVIEIS